MMAAIPGGCTLWAKKVFQSPIFKKPPMYFKGFFWLVGNAAFSDGYMFKGRTLNRGQVITTYAAIAEALSYCFNRAIIKPSLKEIRTMLSWLQSEGMISMEPLTDGTSANRGRLSDLTRAYVGLLITIINFDTYQDYQSYKGRDKGRPSDEQGQLRINNKKINKKTFLSDSIEIRLSELLLKRIASRNPNFKNPNIQAWAKEVDLMIRLDGRDVSEINRVIEWSQQDQFWQSNILSTSKLRKQFDQLRAKMQGNGVTNDPIKLPFRPDPEVFECPRCRRQIIIKNDLTESGCINCEMEAAHARQ